MKLKLICLLGFLLFFPSLFNYFSHDDFFNLQLARINSPLGFLQFFNLFHSPDRVGSYRPLTTQVYFLVSWLFNLSPYPLHIIAFAVYFLDIFLVYKLTKILFSDERTSLIVSFLYTVSATHFAHLYWPSLFQETGLVFFFLLSVILFLKKRHILSLLAMVGGLTSKETAIMIPAVLALVVFIKGHRQLIWRLVPFFLLTAVFLLIHLVFFGLPPGDVYRMDFSPRFINTLSWYFMWSFNLPELFVDYIGPGFHLNFNLIRFYGWEVAAIMMFFLSTVGSTILIFKKLDYKILFLCLGWFLLTLLPVIFLPWHKFTYELGVPLVGLTLLLGHLLAKASSRTVLTFCGAWFLTSFVTLHLTFRTHWITLGPQVAKRVEQYLSKNYGNINRSVVFYDTLDDASLPWSPANEVKIDLSNQDFFEVYYPGRFRVDYVSSQKDFSDPNTTYIKARQFLGY